MTGLHTFQGSLERFEIRNCFPMIDFLRWGRRAISSLPGKRTVEATTSIFDHCRPPHYHLRKGINLYFDAECDFSFILDVSILDISA